MHNLRLIFFWCLMLMGGAALANVLYGQSDARELSPCSETLTWRIGEVDTRFDVDKATLKRLMQEVGKQWSDAAGRNVLAYSDTGQVTLNLIYGKQQQITDDEQRLSRKIDQLELVHQAIEEEYETLYYRHETLSEEYNERRALYIEKAEDYNWTVRRGNRDGVVHDLDNDRLKELKQQVKELEKELRAMEKKLNSQVKKLVELSSRLDNVANKVNRMIYNYSDLFGSGRTFYQGVFIDDLNNQKINIYEFSSLDRLRLVLAHEVGHALGLKHLDDPTSVMHFEMRYQNAKNLQLSEEDKKAIHNFCKSDPS